MATIVLQAAGAVVGTMLGGPVGGFLGRALGALGGYAIDNALFSGSRHIEGPRLAAARIQDADEGAGIARVYGTARIAGQVIWMTRFEESSSTERQGGKGGAGGASVTSYSYFGNVAIGICEGRIAGIRRIWADGEEVDLSELTLRVHRGDEDQMPDPLIEAKQGAGNAPAYRGLAYAVFERLPLERWGNRIPQFSFEVLRPVGELERCVRAVTVIPGASEHGLDPAKVRERVRKGEDRTLNRNVLFGSSDFEASIDELTGQCPNLERVALVVAWFGDDLRAGTCTIRPGVEARSRNETITWAVGPTGRADAHLMSKSGSGPAYGGTPSDEGVVRAIEDLKRRALKVTYYPFVMMDVPEGNARPDPYGGTAQAPYPWRGRITLDVAPGRPGSPDRTAAAAEAVARFVGTARPTHFAVQNGKVAYRGPAEWSYRRMVLHQACLAKLAGGVDAFVIGSELRGLTRIRDASGAFPFVAALAALAVDVKTILPQARITYAADWSEYFGYRPEDGSGDVFFNLDPLWSHPAVDMVGIDNYLPVADWRDEDAGGGGPDGAASPYHVGTLREGVAGGEDFDWYYRSEADRQARLRTPITDGLGKPWTFRAKDLKGWWENRHFGRRNGVEAASPTAWVPRSKPIWLTELGCPAIDKGANQPNVFLDPKSAESFAPRFSNGARDDLMQRRFLEAHLRRWDPAAEDFEETANPVSPVYGGRMLDPSAIHLWTWDARPYPAFPGRADIWSDGANWQRGHWLTGRLGQAPVDALIASILADHGFAEVDASGVDALIDGFVVSGPGSARAELEELMRLCGIAAHAEGRRLVFRSIGFAGRPHRIEVLAEPDEGGALFELRRSDESESAEEIVVGYLDPGRAYQPAAAEALRAGRSHPRQDRIEAPAVMDEAKARAFARDALVLATAGREAIRFALPPTEVALDPGDVVELPEAPGRWLVTRIETGTTRGVEARAIPAARPVAAREDGDVPLVPPSRPAEASVPHVLFLDLPLGDASAPEAAARIATFVHPPAPLVVEASVAGGPFETRLLDAEPSTLGELVEALGGGPEGRIHSGGSLVVKLQRGALFSIPRERLLAGGNLAAVRSASDEWEVLQFQDAEEVAPGTFRLRTLVRAQGGTEDAMAAGALIGAAFVLLDKGCEPIGLKGAEIGTPVQWRVAGAGRALDAASTVTETLSLGLRAVRPLSPVNPRCVFSPDGGVALSFVRRTRVAGDGWDGIEVPLGEEIERYRVVIAGEGGGQSTFEIAAPRLALSVAEQVAAFGGLPARLAVRVSQFSLRHGAGTERRAVFDRPSAS